jgi:hypothetical protein
MSGHGWQDWMRKCGIVVVSFVYSRSLSNLRDPSNPCRPFSRSFLLFWLHSLFIRLHPCYFELVFGLPYLLLHLLSCYAVLSLISLCLSPPLLPLLPPHPAVVSSTSRPAAIRRGHALAIYIALHQSVSHPFLRFSSLPVYAASSITRRTFPDLLHHPFV